MGGACISLVLILFVIFVIILISGLIKKQNSYIYLKAIDDPESIECVVRSLLWKNPGAEIVVLVYSDNPETDEILQRLKNDYPQLHIIKK